MTELGRNFISVLVVEDDDAHAHLIARALGRGSSAHAHVSFASSVAAGRGALREHKPDIDLADLNLRDGRALDLVEGPLVEAGFPIVVLTSQGDEQAAVECIRSGAIDYVVKSPAAFADLPRTVERALRAYESIQRSRQAELAMRESEQRFRALFTAAPDAFVIYDLAGVILDGNPAAEELFGLRVADTIGQGLLEAGIIVDESIPTARALLAAQARRERTGPELIHLRRRDKRTLVVEVRTAPVEVQGRPAVIATLRDVTTRVRAEQERRRLEDQLHHASKLQALGRLAGGVAHDFNNMLTAILSYSELLLAQLPEGSPLRVDVDGILDAGRRASSLTSQLLAFSRKQVSTPVITDLNRLVSGSAAMIRRVIGEHFALVVATAAKPLMVRVDPIQIEQVLVNLAVNARDAMPNGGAIRFATRARYVDKIPAADAAEASPGNYAVLEVCDDGVGMSDDVLSRLFEPFFTTKAVGKGTGLGLSILYGVVKQSGGFIEVTSTVNVGSCFTIHLPLTTELPSSTPPPSPDACGSGETILLVEDDHAVLPIVERLLVRLGFKVLAARTADIALQFSADPNRRIDLMLTDVIMPDMNGRQLFERMRADRPGLRVVYMSGYTDDIVASHVGVTPGTFFIAKPFSRDALARKLREALDA
ncbi:MAG: response regulator [Polyangiaceae bacterium]